MAEKKTKEEVVETKPKKAEKTSNLVPVRLFKDGGKYKDDVKVGLNGKLYVIKRGEVVMVPKEVKEILDHSEFQDIETAKMIDGLEADYKGKEKQLN